MKIGRRRSGGGWGGGGRSPSVFERVLHGRIESSKGKYGTVDQLIEYLRTTFPEYGRHKLQPFARHVQHILQIINTANKNKAGDCDRPSASNVDGVDDDDSTPSQSLAHKRMRKIDRSEEKLQLLETQHMLKKQKSQKQQPLSISSSLVSMSLSPSSSDEAEDGAVSTSEDAIYGEKFEPEFDLMRSMLRETYSGSKSAKSKAMEDVEEKNMELEVINNKNRKFELIEGDRTDVFGKDLGNREAKVSSNQYNCDDMQKNGGPRFKDLGGITAVLEELKMEVIIPLYHPQLPQWLGVRPVAGILLHGPPGCGKTRLAHAIANETGLPFYKISATELVSGISGASEENIRKLFSKAYRTAPSIVFIDEIDAIASKRENLQREMERRIVTQLMTCMDESHGLVKPTNYTTKSESFDCKPGHVLVIGATNRPDAVDPALRRPGRFDREIYLGIPDENARVEILSMLTRKVKLEGVVDFVKIARLTPGFVGADLKALVGMAGNLAMKRIINQRKHEISKEFVYGEDSEEWWKQPWSHEEMERLNITMIDFEEAAKMVQPSSRREGFSTIPNVKWQDVGGLDMLRQEFDRHIVRQIKYPNDFEEFGIDLETGFLLYGPPGCGKTFIAKAVANEAGANFIHIKGPELLNKYVGESELAVRTMFSRARKCSPCILFFDEVDALTTNRGREGGWVVERLLNQLLIELDGADQRRGVYVIGATNRPEVMDRALLRPGRLGRLLYVPLPSPDDRGLILRALSRKKPIDESVDLIAFGKSEGCKNLSGADLAALMNEAAMTALEEKLASGQSTVDGTQISWSIKERHLEQALKKISPSVSDKQIQYYQRLSESFKAARD